MRRTILGCLLWILACGGPASRESLESSGRPGDPLALGSPVTVALPLSGALREQLEAVASGRAPDRTVRLNVEGVEITGHGNFAIRVFLGWPDADASTPTGDSHYVGVFAPSHEGKAGSKTGFLLDASRALARVGASLGLDRGQDLRVTLVAVPLREGERPPAPIRIERVVLSVDPLGPSPR